MLDSGVLVKIGDGREHVFLPKSEALSAPSVAIFLRLRLRLSDAGEKSQRWLGP